MYRVLFFVLLIGNVNASLLDVWTQLFSLDQLSKLFSAIISYGQLPPPPEAKMTTLEIVHHYGYRWERHVVATKDGYLLELHRIPPAPGRYNSTNSHPVLLQHGFIGSSSHFVINGPTDSLAFVLADAGYDVWMGNLRGNVYSRRHLKLYPDTDDAFWDFSLDEHAMLDLPAMIDHILKTTRQPQLTYVGHSMGSSISAIFLSKHSDYCKKLRRIIWLGPVIYGTYTRSAIRILVSKHQTIRTFLDLIYDKEVFWAPKWVKEFAASFTTSHVGLVVFEFILGILSGFSEDLLHREYLPVLASHGTEGTSWMVVLHNLQIFREGKMRNFDWNSQATYKKYRSTNRIEYNLEDIECPINAFWGRMDTFTDATDFPRLMKEIKYLTVEEVVTQESKYWSHLDFILSRNARKHHYAKLLHLINNP